MGSIVEYQVKITLLLREPLFHQLLVKGMQGQNDMWHRVATPKRWRTEQSREAGKIHVSSAEGGLDPKSIKPLGF